MSLYFSVLLFCVFEILDFTESKGCREEQRLAKRHHLKGVWSHDQFNNFHVPKCAGDLWVPLQTSTANFTSWCVDPSTGEILTEASKQLTSCDGCLAKRLKILFEVEKVEHAGGVASNVYFPECQNNYPDLYEEIQCWIGYFNACWCVNTTTGEALSTPRASQDLICAHENTGFPIPWCSLIQSLVRNYFHYYYLVKESNNDLDFTPDLELHLHCNKQGYFEDQQCINNVCWCVDPVDGNILESTSCLVNEGPRHDACFQHKDEQFSAYYYLVIHGIMLEQFTIPQCTQLGTWEYIQCTNQTLSGNNICWCVDKATGKPTTSAHTELKSCSSCLATQLKNSRVDINDMTTCDESGELFTLIQCNKDYECWCVDPRTGAVILEGDGITGEKCEKYLEII